MNEQYKKRMRILKVTTTWSKANDRHRFTSYFHIKNVLSFLFSIYIYIYSLKSQNPIIHITRSVTHMDLLSRLLIRVVSPADTEKIRNPFEIPIHIIHIYSNKMMITPTEHTPWVIYMSPRVRALSLTPSFSYIPIQVRTEQDSFRIAAFWQGRSA